MSKPDGSKPLTSPQLAALVLAHVFAVLALVFVVMWATYSDTGHKYLGGLNWNDKVFNWHPVLMVAGFVFSYTEAVLAFRTFPFGKRINKLLHGFWHAAALVCVGVGLAAVFRSHNTTASSGKYIANLYSMHSWCGIATILLFGQNYLFGFLMFVIGASPNTRAEYLPYHMFLGKFTYCVAAFTAIIGIQEKNGFIGCSYAVTQPDNNPAEHFVDIPEGCRVSNGLGLVILATALCASFAAANMGAKSTRPMADDVDRA